MVITSFAEQFIRDARAIDYQRFFPELFLVPSAELKDWFPTLIYSGKPKFTSFHLDRFAYPSDPVTLMIAVASQNPYLVTEGYCGKSHLKTVNYIVQRDWLFHPHFIAQFCDAYGWLRCLERSNGYFQDGSSYSLKHYCERTIRYVSNGALIAAALALDLKVEPPSRSEKSSLKNPKIGVKTASARAAQNYGMWVENYVSHPPLGSFNFNFELGKYHFCHFDNRIYSYPEKLEKTYL